MNQRLHSHRLLLALAVSLAAFSVSRADLIDSYDGDTLTVGNITSWTDETGGENATTADAVITSNGIVVGTVSGDPVAANTDSAFNGNTYVSFGANSGLGSADALFIGNSDRTVVAVYDNPSGANEQVDPIAGEAGSTNNGSWFMLQARNGAYSVQGNPYLAGYNDDTGSGSAPQTDVLTFALATYDSSSGVETVYYAYGGGAISSESVTADPSLDTTDAPFTIGYDPEEASQGDMNVGTVDVYNNSMTSAQADTAIKALQVTYGYAVPEPSTVAMVLGGVVLLGCVIRRRSNGLS